MLWAALWAAVVAETSIIVSLWVIDFVHGNPNRTQANALEMMLMSIPFFAIVAVIGIVLVFGVSQFLQAVALGAFVRRFQMRLGVVALLTLPAAASA